MSIFEEVHPDYLQKMQGDYPKRTYNDLRLLALLRMNFSIGK